MYYMDVYSYIHLITNTYFTTLLVFACVSYILLYVIMHDEFFYYIDDYQLYFPTLMSVLNAPFIVSGSTVPVKSYWTIHNFRHIITFYSF